MADNKPQDQGFVQGRPRAILRIEGLAIFAASLICYSFTGQGWGWFFLLLLLPDISFAGYLAGPRIGSLVYNLFHSLVFPLLMFSFAALLQELSLVWPALIWLAHIGLDRFLGFGLKYPQSFQHTHLGLLRGKKDS